RRCGPAPFARDHSTCVTVLQGSRGARQSGRDEAAAMLRSCTRSRIPPPCPKAPDRPVARSRRVARDPRLAGPPSVSRPATPATGSPIAGPRSGATARSAEDRTFWTNDGFDPAAIIAAVADNASTGSSRGASTITQQLVRARLLPQDVIAPGANRYVRKAKELIQSARLTAAYPGETGKQ